MRTVNSHLLEDKMDDPVTHYINHGTDPHQQGEVPVDAHGLSLNVQEDGTGRVVTVMQSQNFPQICRQISVGEQTEGAWPEDLADAEGRLAALVAHLSRQNTQPKIQHVRSEVDTSVILDTPMRLFQGQTLHDHQTESIVVQVPSLPPFPPLQNMKRCSEPEWYKEKPAHRPESPILDEQVLALGSPAHKLTSKKSLPHKKRISRKLKRNTGNCTPQQVSEEIVVINCAEDIRQEEILPDTFVSHPEHLDEHHMVRAIFICQLCGLFFADEQLKFYSHLKQHYEPHDLLLQPELPADKITNTCIVDNSSALPDSIVELSLENSVPKGMYHDKHILYSHSDKINYNKVQYTMEKEPSVNGDMVKSDLYETFDKLDLYCCVKCNKSFRKQKHCEAHIKEVHSNSKLEDMSEFSEPEDLMEGIHVCVSDGEPYEAGLLPTLTVENGHVHQGGRHWYSRSNTNTVNQCVNDGYCPMCEPQPTIVANSHAANAGPTVEPTAVPTAVPTPANESRENDGVHLKEEVLQRIFEPQYTESILPTPVLDPAPPAPPAPPATGDKQRGKEGKKGDDSLKRFECVQCGKVFLHRNSLIYHILSHKERTQRCKDCGKAFYTLSALRIHRRVHNGDKPYKCDDCGRAFRQWSDLKYHRSSIHSTQKNFKCDFCGKEFARKYSLNVHRRIHTGEKNYPCEFCGKTFRASSYRLSHMRTHTGDKPYKCAECLKCFRVAGDLKRHSLIHDKFRNRIEEQQKKIAAKTNDKNHIKLEEDSPEPKDGKDTKKKPAKRSQIKKISAPNVTVNKTGELQFKLADYSNSVEVYDTRQDAYQPYTKSDSVKDNLSEFTLKTEYRNAAENSDGKLHIYTHVEKSEGPVSLTDMKDLRTELHGEPIENGFFAKLTALYNITTD